MSFQRNQRFSVESLISFSSRTFFFASASTMLFMELTKGTVNKTLAKQVNKTEGIFCFIFHKIKPTAPTIKTSDKTAQTQ